ncbi:MAG TPA: holdfast anchoring protein HfaA [Caulobacteraceae bacterium]|jgi:holdfast attachment protein HfaA|nr:holdfast anchoring protein HfaA [Caulobacteraceae bacterium]
MAIKTASALGLGAGLAFAALFATTTGASAQTMNANSASFNAGFGRTAGEENRPVNVALTDGSGNTTLVNGLIQPVAGGIFAEVPGVVGAPVTANNSSTVGGAGGASDSFSGVGGGSSASAIGNSLNVVVQGDNNTVIVNSTQTNTGAVTATTNGK